MTRAPALTFPLTLAIGLLCTPLAAQQIPMPIPDTAETRQISVTVTPGVRSMRGLPTRLRITRGRMLDGEILPDAALRQLAERGDGLAAQRLVRRLQQTGTAPASDVAYFSAIAVGTGRVWTLPDMVDAMQRLDPQAEPRARVRKYISVLYPHAWAGNTLALDAVQRFNGAGRLFGPLSDATRDKILAQSRKNADGRAELRMALALLEEADAAGQISAAQDRQVRALLVQVAKSDSLAATTTAQNLLRLMETRYGPPG